MSDVSRGTPSPPDEARRAFPSERLDLAQRYVELLATVAVERGLIGPRETARLWERHILNCLAVAELIPAGSSVADLGSGAGLPGLVLAIGRPDLAVSLVEPLERRTRFLSEVVEELRLERVRVVRARAEALRGVETFDVVTARALAPLSRLLGWGMPLVASSGALLAMKGSTAAEEVRSASTMLRRLRCRPPEILVCTAAGTGSTATVVRVAHQDRRGLG